MIIQPAVVIVAFNRPKALRRILHSIAHAEYGLSRAIPLIISIDGGGENHSQVVHAAKEFEWNHGKKRVIDHSENLGLRNHVLSCGDLSRDYQRVILLEEDCFVSRNYYTYACRALDFYRSDPSIAGISLYSNSFDESEGMPFCPIQDGYDVYFMQVPSSWGQAWTKEQWDAFKGYYSTNPAIKDDDQLPEKVKMWPESSWKKYFYKYLVDKDLFFVYPQVSFSTNFGDQGTHHLNCTDVFQVPLEYRLVMDSFRFVDFTKSCNRYDAYFEMLPRCLISLGAEINEDTCVDLTGGKPLHLFNHKFCLSIKECSRPIQAFSCDVLSPVLNVLYGKPGEFFVYGLKSSFGAVVREKRFKYIQKTAPLQYAVGVRKITTEKYYKAGYRLLHPGKLLQVIWTKLKINFSRMINFVRRREKTS